jgi:hypothetical protein
MEKLIYFRSSAQLEFLVLMEVTQQASGDEENIYGHSVNKEKMFASKIIEKMFYWVQWLTPVIPTI